jgi:aspartate 1-decarboxylase
MLRTMLKSKIHRARVTEADLHYDGSLTLDRDLMDAAGLLPYEHIHVLDINNGNRLETYVIEGARGTGEVCINGAAARLVSPGDLVIVLSYAGVKEEELARHEPKLVYVDEENRITRVGPALEATAA